MRFCKQEAGGIVFPYTFNMLRKDNPQVSFPSDAMNQPDLLASFNVFPVVEVPPTYDTETQRLIQGQVSLVGSNYVLQYTVDNKPSKLVNLNNARHPTTGELIEFMATDPDTVQDYYMSQVQNLKINKVAMDNGLYDPVAQRNGTIKREGNMDKAATYSQIPGSPRRARSAQLMTWRDRVWTFVETRWAEVLSGAQPPTWSELETEINNEHPEP